MFVGYGSQCECCGESERAFLVIDHVRGGGNTERKRFSSVDAFYRSIIKRGFPDDYRVLCANCNQAEAYFGGCPHQK